MSAQPQSNNHTDLSLGLPQDHQETRYRCIVADPPWPERGGGRIKRGADRHYAVMGVRKIAETMLAARFDDGRSAWAPDPAGCHLWLWVTDNYLQDGLWLMNRLSFRYVRTFCWVKTRDNDAANARLQIGLGQYARGAHELCLFGVQGKPQIPPPKKRPPSVLLAPRTTHSRKPDACFGQWFESVSPEPRLEMFARTSRPGWHAWGNELS